MPRYQRANGDLTSGRASDPQDGHAEPVRDIEAVADEQVRFAGIAKLLIDMRETMMAANGAGLAAPQIGENVRVVIFEVGDNPRYPGREKSHSRRSSTLC